MDDNELVQAALSGDQGAYTELYTRLLPRLRPVAYRYLRATLMQDEGAHDMVTHIFEHLAQFNGEAKFTTWAITVGQNYALSLLRKGKSTRRCIPGVPVELDDPDSIQVADKDAHYRQVDARQDVEKILELLPPGYRKVLEARFLLDLTFVETADSIGMSVGASKSQSFKGLKRARQIADELEVMQ